MVTSAKYKDEILNEINELSDEQMANLVKIIRLFKESIKPPEGVGFQA